MPTFRPIAIDPTGARITVVTPTLAQSLDLSLWARRWVKVYADKSFWYFMAPSGDLSTYAFNLSGLAAPGSIGIPLGCVDGETGVEVFVSLKNPWLHVRAKVNNAEIVIKPISDIITSE